MTDPGYCSRLHDRRNDVFGRAFVDSTAQPAMAHAVEEINEEPENQPDHEANPGQDRQTEHQRDAENHAENWEPRDHRNAEWPRPRRIGPPQNNDAEADEDE